MIEPEPERSERGRRGRRGSGRGSAGERDGAERSSRAWLDQLGPFALAEVCGSRFVDVGRDYLGAIAAAVQPVGPQRGKIDDLARSMESAAQGVAATCTGDVAMTPPGRFEAIDRRLDSVLAAVRQVRAAMDALWASLDDEQKARVTALELRPERPSRRSGRRGRRGRLRF